MRSFRHLRGRIMFEIFSALLLASIAAARWEEEGKLSSIIAAVGLTSYALFRSLRLCVSNPALAYGHRGVQVGTLFGVKDYRWDQVRDIREAVWERPRIPYLCWVPKERQYLELEIVGGGSVRLRPDMMELPPNGVKEIIKRFRDAQVAALGERGAAMARLGAKEAKLAPAPVLGVQAERLHRLGIGADPAEPTPVETAVSTPMPQAGAPSRPVFGRKVS